MLYNSTLKNILTIGTMCAVTLCGSLQAFAGERLSTNELKTLFLDTSVEYDYGDFKAYAYTQKNGVNYFHMNGNEYSFDEEDPIIKTDAKIAKGQVCFHKGWVVCWMFEKSDTKGLYIGRGTDTGEFYATVRKLNTGDVLKIKNAFSNMRPAGSI